MFVKIYDYVRKRKIILNLKSVVYIEGYDPYDTKCLRIYTMGGSANDSNIRPLYFDVKNKDDINRVISTTSGMS